MKSQCPHCEASGKKIADFGFFVRKSDKRKIPRYRCEVCLKTFSKATFHKNYRQRKRHLHGKIRKYLCSGVSQRRIAKLLNISRTTVDRKIRHLGAQDFFKNQKYRNTREEIQNLQFDDLETFEHTKCKPVSVTIAVEKKTRKILHFKVSRMPAKGRLAKVAGKKYGLRRDERREKREALFKELTHFVSPFAEIISDQSPHYPETVKKWFPHSTHKTCKGQRGCIVGQGELKRGGFDPLFSLNHTYAMIRDNLKRLSRRTWCTTKKIENLEHQLNIYMSFHNQYLTK